MSVQNVKEEKPYHREFIYNLPETIFFDTDLTINDLRVYGVIRSFMDTRGDAYPSNNWIARRLQIHRTTAITCINRLIGKDYIVKEDIKGHRHLRIKINPIPQKVLAPDSDLVTPTLVVPTLPPSSAATTPPSSAHATQLDQTTITSKNIKTTTTGNAEKSTSSSVISKEIDERLLDLRDKYIQADDLDRTGEEFLRQCSHHLDNGDKQKYNLTRRLKGLETILRKGFFEKPAGYDEKKVIKSIFTPEETALIQMYQHALRMVNFGAKLEDYMPKPQEIKKAIELMEKSKNHKIVFDKAA